MKMIMVTQCCCGCSVRTGTLIIGVLHALSSLLDFGLEMFMLDGTKHKGNDITEEDGIMSRGEVIVSIILNVIVFCACVSLIYGTLKERLNFIFIWVIVMSVYTGLIIMFILQLIITVIIRTESVDRLYELPVLLIVIGLTAYSVIVVNSHYRNIKDGVTLPPRPPLVIVV